MKTKLRNILFSAIVLHSCLALQLPTAYCAEPTIRVSQTQYNLLVNNNRALVLRLETLQLTLEKLKNPSAELAKQLAECNIQLNEANLLLSTTQEKLTISQRSLASAEALQKQTELSLKKLELQITNMQRKYKRERLYGWIFGTIGGVIIGRCAKVKLLHNY